MLTVLLLLRHNRLELPTQIHLHLVKREDLKGNVGRPETRSDHKFKGHATNRQDDTIDEDEASSPQSHSPSKKKARYHLPSSIIPTLFDVGKPV